MNKKTKKLLIQSVPYVLVGLFATNLGEAYRVGLVALDSLLPSFHPLDLLVGVAVGLILRLWTNFKKVDKIN